MAYIGGLTKNELKALIVDQLAEFKSEVTELRKQLKEVKEALASKSKELYTYSDLKELFGVSRATLHNWVKEGKLIKHKIGSRVEFKRIDIERLINNSKH